jgi:hypothetical protein
MCGWMWVCTYVFIEETTTAFEIEIGTLAVFKFERFIYAQKKWVVSVVLLVLVMVSRGMK